MRIPNDQYFTPPELVHVLQRSVSFFADETYFEPCAGDGAINKCFSNAMITADLDPDMDVDVPRFDATLHQDWVCHFAERGIETVDWVITNPPYKQPDCDAIIQNAWDFANKGIAMLLRLSYLEPCKGRAQFLKDNWLSHLIVLNPRPQFIPGKKTTDSSTAAWFVWQKNWKQMSTRTIFCDDWRSE